MPVRPLVRPSVRNASFSNSRGEGEGRGKWVMWGVEGAGGGRGGAGKGSEGPGKGVTRGPDASDVWRDQTSLF